MAMLNNQRVYILSKGWEGMVTILHILLSWVSCTGTRSCGRSQPVSHRMTGDRPRFTPFMVVVVEVARLGAPVQRFFRRNLWDFHGLPLVTVSYYSQIESN